MPPLACVVGARPNLVKAAPLIAELTRREVPCRVVHTGQHYDHEMSRVFFEELSLPEPDAFLGVGSGSHGVQTALALMRLEEWLLANPADAVLAIGDVNSTLAAALAAVKIQVPVVHVEAGYRSRDMAMPEEVNRLVTDHVSTMLLPPTEDARDNLVREGIPDERIRLVGNLMAETFLRFRDRAEAARTWERFDVERGRYAMVTIHRPENADDPRRLQRVCRELGGVGMPVVWPVHPRARSLLEGMDVGPAIRFAPPLPYLESIGLLLSAAVAVTDSGGVQEEACLAGVPCVTVRTSTERVATLQLGANRLTAPERLAAAIEEARSAPRGWSAPALWDEEVSSRAADAILVVDPGV